MSLTDRIRAGRRSGAASSVPPSVLVVGESAPVGRTVTRELSTRLSADDLAYIEQSRQAAWVRRARAGQLPTHRDLPEEGGAL